MEKTIKTSLLCLGAFSGVAALGVGAAAGRAGLGAATACAMLLAAWLSGIVVWDRIGSRLSGTGADGFPELRPLRAALEAQERRLRDSARSLEEKERDLDAVRDNMKEGLILVDRKGYILSMNHAAAAMLGVEPADYKGRYLSRVSSHPSFQSAVLTAMGGTAREELLEINGAAVSVFADPVRVGSEMRGAVVLLFDVSERAAAEQMRREFTANVSHELKTPLTTISGYAELLQAGLIKPEDVRRAGESIRRESARLIALIDDIIDLSRLDEGNGSAEREDVDLLELAGEIRQRLAQAAQGYGVTMRVGGSGGTVKGERRMLDEMITNLADNALKYNHPGGWVEIAVNGGAQAVLEVSDNGIGIPREHQPHVFERFYRVDKSRSKSTGGTGLGLSIVKHAAAAHNAELTLDSLPGRGTRITLRFPAPD